MGGADKGLLPFRGQPLVGHLAMVGLGIEFHDLVVGHDGFRQEAFPFAGLGQMVIDLAVSGLGLGGGLKDLHGLVVPPLGQVYLPEVALGHDIVG